MSPRTPQIETQPLFVALRAFFSKIRGRGRADPWIYTQKLYKSLIVERKFLAGCACFSTGCLSSSTCLGNLSTGSFFGPTARISIYLSLLKEEGRREEAVKGKAAIHGLEKLPKNASTGFHPYPRLFRGFSWIRFHE
jgi:hypothetical protein